MEQSQSQVLMWLFSSWGVITVVLIVLVIYRATLASREDDQIFIDAAEQHHYQEQQAMVARLSRLTAPIIVLAVLSGVLLLAAVGMWVYQGFTSS